MNVRKQVIITALLMAAIAIQAQVDPVEKGFNTSPDTVFGVLVGILVLFGIGAASVIVAFVRKILKWLDGYMGQRMSGDTQRTTILENLLTETKSTNEKIDTLVDLQTAQGEKIVHIDNKVGAIEKDLDEVKSKIGNLETDLQNLKG